MRCKGWLKNLSQNWESKRLEVMFEVEASPADVEKYKDKELSVDIKQYRQRRSLEANAYYWALCTQIADAISQSISYTHNYLLRQYGQIEIIDGQLVKIIIPDTQVAEDKVFELETVHLKPIDNFNTGNDGIVYRTYLLLKGSHSYDTKEMSRLIDGTISEAKELGIETITENEKREMLERYGKKYSAG